LKPGGIARETLNDLENRSARVAPRLSAVRDLL
jgi:hypothetical protein